MWCMLNISNVNDSDGFYIRDVQIKLYDVSGLYLGFVILI